MRLKVIMSLIMILAFAGQIQADLLQEYTDTDTTHSRGQISYGFGVNIPTGPTGGGNLISLSGGVNKMGSCAFSAVSQISALFNKEAMDQYVSGLENAIVAGAPLLLLCYASQTLCDLYKHFRNMANATLALRNAQCSQVEALAAQAGTSLRNNSVLQCITNAMNNGTAQDYDSAVDGCTSNQAPLVQIPNSLTQAQSFNLTDALAKAGTSDPNLQNLITGVLGNITFSAQTGIYNPGKVENGMETQVGNYTQAFYNASRDVGEQFAQSLQCPGDDQLKTISIPGSPITCYTLSKLAAFDPVTRDNFYHQYSTVAAMNQMLYELEAAIDLMQQTKASTQDKDTVAAIEDGIKEMQRDYDLMEKRMALQQNYLVPMMSTMLGYKPPPHDAPASDQERQYGLPNILPQIAPPTTSP